MERSVILTQDNTITKVHLPGVRHTAVSFHLQTLLGKTHRENERDYIVAVLNHCKGKIYGPGGAAQILDLKVGTLNSKIKKLGITKDRNVFTKSVE